MGTRFMAQLAWSGNWQMQFNRAPTDKPLKRDPLQVELGIRFDFGGALTLPPGRSFETPPVAFTASTGDLDEAANHLHRYQREFIAARTPTNDPLLVQFNSWYPFQGKMTVGDMKRCADVAAELGAEVFVLDAGWFNKTNWSAELGDWQADPVAFPNGLKELADHAHGKGMKFGVWLEIENLGTESQMFKQHPDWCFAYNGRAVLNDQRYQLNFAKPEVRAWAFKVLDDLARGLPLEWVKIDYNIDIGERFDPAGLERTGDALIGHVRGYYAWLDQVRAAHPNVVIENCSSGGMRFDLGILGHTHTTWLSDMVDPIRSVQLAYGSTVEFLPEVCNHWMVGDADNGRVDLGKPPGWWDFMLRVPMNGQYGISSRVFDWNDALKQRAKQAIADYKRIRRVIAGADVYHLTPPPPRDQPTGWMGLQYIPANRQRSVLMAYRLGQSSREHVFRLRGLDPQTVYAIRLDGQQSRPASGEELLEKGLRVEGDTEWRATIVELEATQAP
jgi:alpha-galactosidase